jgi:acetyl-CoA carboxylase carboxyl transferase beta subunit
LLATGDGAMGFWAALEEVFPMTGAQRCWFHKMGNVLNALPASQQAKAKAGLHAIWMAAMQVDAQRAFGQFVSQYQAKHPKAIEKLEKDRELTNLKDAVITGSGTINGKKVVIGVTDSRFIMGSMGSVVGEKLTRIIERSTETGEALVIVSGSGGGARMYEGMYSLMQMAKTSAALSRHNKAGRLFISVLTNPTMAGIMASFASLGDIILAEPKALIGFTGPRVIEQTIRQKLPPGFQRSEFLLDHGLIDMIINRKNLKETLSKLCVYFTSNHRSAKSAS